MSPTSVSQPRLTARSKRGARQTQAVIWSKDSGFADRARQSPGLQVVWLRMGNTTNASLRERLAPLLTTIAAALEDGETVIEIR